MLPRSGARGHERIGRQLVVLATDGDPTECGLDSESVSQPKPNYDSVLARVRELQAEGRELLVLSLGQEVSAAHLQELANIGVGLAPDASPGATVYAAETPQVLRDRLSKLATAAESCELLLDRGIHADYVCDGLVSLNGSPLPCDEANGYRLVAEDRIRLEGTACLWLQSSTRVVLDVDFPCRAQL